MVSVGHMGHPRQAPHGGAPGNTRTAGSQHWSRRRGHVMSARTPEAEPLLTPAEVATMFRVDPKTVTRWAKAGKLTSIRTLGDTGATGRLRFVHCSRVFRSSVPSELVPSSPNGRGPGVNTAALDQRNGGSAPVARCRTEGAVRQ